MRSRLLSVGKEVTKRITSKQRGNARMNSGAGLELKLDTKYVLAHT